MKTVAELAELCGAVVDGDPELAITGPATLAQAGPREISFLANERYASQLAATRAAAVIVGEAVERERQDLTLLRSADPNTAFSAVVEAFSLAFEPPAPGVHETAVVDPAARVDATAHVGPYCVLEADVEVGAHAVLLTGAVLSRGARVGERTVLHPHVTLYAGVVVGNDCVLHSGAVLGADGFGFDFRDGAWHKIPQCGTVVIEDHVEIGACTTVDRARFGATTVRRGAKIDNLVHVAHNVEIEAGALLAAQVGVAGSTTIGRGAVIGGQVGIIGHARIGDGARVGGKSGVFGNLEGGIEYAGFPARPRAEALRLMAMTGRLPRMQERLEQLEGRLKALEEGR